MIKYKGHTYQAAASPKLSVRQEEVLLDMFELFRWNPVKNSIFVRPYPVHTVQSLLDRGFLFIHSGLDHANWKCGLTRAGQKVASDRQKELGIWKPKSYYGIE